MNKANRYTIIRESGRSEFHDGKTYQGILSNTYHEYMGAGTGWDRPNMLLYNGKIAVSSGLSEIAYRYGQVYNDLAEERQKILDQEFKTEWEE